MASDHKAFERSARRVGSLGLLQRCSAAFHARLSDTEGVCQSIQNYTTLAVSCVKGPPRIKTMNKEPTDLRKALAAALAAKAQWDDLTPIARWDFISWIDSAKQPETRRRRIERACAMLAAGKRRPCCFSIVPLDLHNALAVTPMAKTRWSDLTPTARRGFISWIESAKQRDARRRRIDEA